MDSSMGGDWSFGKFSSSSCNVGLMLSSTFGSGCIFGLGTVVASGCVFSLERGFTSSVAEGEGFVVSCAGMRVLLESIAEGLNKELRLFQ